MGLLLLSAAPGSPVTGFATLAKNPVQVANPTPTKVKA
jgi:hypothetical protein